MVAKTVKEYQLNDKLSEQVVSIPASSQVLGISAVGHGILFVLEDLDNANTVVPKIVRIYKSEQAVVDNPGQYIGSYPTLIGGFHHVFIT